MLRWYVLLLALSMNVSAFAKVTAAESCEKEPELVTQAKELVDALTEVPGGCAKAEKLDNLCVDIAERVEEPIESPFAYRYERLVHEAACADPEKDSEDLINRKIQSMWVKLDPKCNNANFDVPRGSVLKYSILTRNYDFISLAAEIWKVNLNAIDPSDNRTLLDYIQKEAERNKGTKAETILKGYYKTLRDLGAKHRNEL